jgi:hypothetical protein
MSPEWIGFATIICMFGGPVLVGVVWVIARAWSRVSMYEREIELKHRLLDAGMTAGEIERVMNAGGARDEADDGAPSGPTTQAA